MQVRKKNKFTLLLHKMTFRTELDIEKIIAIIEFIIGVLKQLTTINATTVKIIVHV